MGIFGDLERFISEDLYPYRYFLTAAAIAAVIACIAFVYWRGWHKVLWSHKIMSTAIGVPLLVVGAIAGDYFVSPLWERSTVCEASPIAGVGTGSDRCGGLVVAATNPPASSNSGTPAAAPADDAPASGTAAATDEPPASAAPAFAARVVTQGQFFGADDFHFGEGDALLIETAPGQYTLRFENFSVRNGPDLFAYLSSDPAGFSDDGINLGTLKATDGAFNYDVPAGTDVSRFKSAIVWCKSFEVLFAAATFAAG